QLDLHHVLHRLELDVRVADAEHGAGAQVRLANAQVTDVDAVARVQIAEAVPVVAGRHLEVRARDRFVLDDEVADDAPAARDARLGDLELLALIGPVQHDELALAQPPHGCPLALEQRGKPGPGIELGVALFHGRGQYHSDGSPPYWLAVPGPERSSACPLPDGDLWPPPVMSTAPGDHGQVDGAVHRFGSGSVQPALLVARLGLRRAGP